MLTWIRHDPDRSWLAANGFAVLTFEELRARFIAPARAAGARRTTIDSPVQPLLDRYARHQGVALLGVHLAGLADLRDLYGYVLEPAWRAGCRLIVQADRDLDEAPIDQLVDPEFGHPWTFERARYLVSVMSATVAAPAAVGEPQPSRALDAEQLAAVGAHDGVVQIIAPAGSGKTTVLVERVREGLRRGTPADRTLCMTFNRDAAQELRHRLQAAGVAQVEARTFHSVGRWILAEEGLLRGETRSLTLAQWKRLCVLTQQATGEWIDPPDARAIVSQAKLGLLATVEEFAEQAPATRDGVAAAHLYRAYQAELEAREAHDFDDQLMLAVRALRSDPLLRARWQQRFDRVLVDEYQDIEPAQELLVQILAAPQDSLFCVGDADQTLYGWRRASVARIVTLDQTYPGLARVALKTNYRCPVSVVEHSSRLVATNQVRFPLAIAAAPGRTDAETTISLDEHPSLEAAAEWTARALADRERGDIVVLARTSRLLRSVAEACVAPAIAISAPPAIFEARGAQAVIEAHLRLAAAPRQATPDDVQLVMRHPSRGLPLHAEKRIAAALVDGATWEAAVTPVAGRSTRVTDAAALFDMLADETDAAKFIRRLRRVGELDRHFAEYERTFGGAEQTETEALEDAERQAAGKTVAEFARALSQRRDALLAIRDDEHGIELTTVHRAKGREWPTVVLFGFDDEQMPHKRALEATPEQEAAGEGLEAERRVAYVALTRAKDRLHVLTTKGRLSPFAWQADLAQPPAPPTPSGPANTGRVAARAPRRNGPPPGPPGSEHVTKIGAKYAVRVASTRSAGMRIAAWSIRHNLVNGDTAAGKVTARDYLLEIPDVAGGEVDAVLAAAGVQPHELARLLSARPRQLLADELERRA